MRIATTLALVLVSMAAAACSSKPEQCTQMSEQERREFAQSQMQLSIPLAANDIPFTVAGLSYDDEKGGYLPNDAIWPKSGQIGPPHMKVDGAKVATVPFDEKMTEDLIHKWDEAHEGGFTIQDLLNQITKLQEDLSKMSLDDIKAWATTPGIDENERSLRNQFVQAADLFHESGHYGWYREQAKSGPILWYGSDASTKYNIFVKDCRVAIRRWVVNAEGQSVEDTAVDWTRRPYRNFEDAAASIIMNTPSTREANTAALKK